MDQICYQESKVFAQETKHFAGKKVRKELRHLRQTRLPLYARNDATIAGKKDATTARNDASTDEAELKQQVPASNNDATVNEAKLEQQVAEFHEWFSTHGLDVVKEEFEMPLDDGSPEDIKFP